MTKIDFWQVTDDPIEKVVALIAKRVLDDGARLLVVSEDADQRDRISRALWQAGPDTFLAHGEAAAVGAQRQPILLSPMLDTTNGANHAVFADGHLRDTTGFERVFLLFTPDAVPAARQAWSAQDGREGVEPAYFAQENRRWVKKR
jgi:DNA polymerase III subunit chi